MNKYLIHILTLINIFCLVELGSSHGIEVESPSDGSLNDILVDLKLPAEDDILKKDTIYFDRFLVMFNSFLNMESMKNYLDQQCQKKLLLCNNNSNSSIESESEITPRLVKIYDGPLFGLAIDVPRSIQTRKFTNMNLVKSPYMKSISFLPPYLRFLSGLLPVIDHIENDRTVKSDFTFKEISTDAIDSFDNPIPSENQQSYFPFKSLSISNTAAAGVSKFFPSRPDKIQMKVPWHLSRISKREKIKPNAQHSYFYHQDFQGEGVNVYIVDSGIFTEHDEFEGRAQMLYDFTGEGMKDISGHGTHVAGTIGGKSHGVAKRAKLLGIKVLFEDHSSDWSIILDAFNWIYNHVQKTGHKRSIVNLSIEGEHSEIINAAIESLHSIGVPVIGAAGNQGEDACSFTPGSSSRAIIVAATDMDDKLIDSPPSNYGKCVTIAAPGAFILSPYIISKSSMAEMNGTSMAAPLVTGVMALYMAAFSSLSYVDIKNKLLERATQNALEDIDAGTPNLLLYSL